MIALRRPARRLELPFTLPLFHFCSRLCKQSSFFRVDSSSPSSHSPFPSANSLACRSIATGRKSSREKSLAADSSVGFDPLSTANELSTLGFESTTIHSLASLPRKSFLEQWQKIQVLLGAGASPAQIRALLGRSRIALRRFIKTPYQNLVAVVKVFESVKLDRQTTSAIITQSAVLRSPIENLKFRLDYFRNLGLERGLLKCLLQRPAWILAVRVSVLEERFKTFKTIGFDARGMQQVVCKFPRILCYDFDKCLLPKVEYLESVGFCKQSIQKLLVRTPGIIGISVGGISRKVEILRKLGIANNVETLVRGLANLSSFRCETIQSRYDWFRNKGFSPEEVDLLGRFSPIFQKSEKDLERRFDYLENTLKRDRREVLAARAYLIYAFESRIVHRFNVLRENGLLNRETNLACVIRPTNRAFERMVNDKLKVIKSSNEQKSNF